MINLNKMKTALMLIVKTLTIQTNQGELDEPKANIETPPINDYAPSHTVEKIASHRSGKQEYSHYYDTKGQIWNRQTI